MNIMNNETWNAMSAAEKLAHFENNEVEVVSKAFNTATPVILYKALCKGVIVSTWLPSEKDALSEASKTIAAAIQNLVIELDGVAA